MKSRCCVLLFLCLSLIGCQTKQTRNSTVLGGQKVITQDKLRDKIKGGWAGQTIGCTFGGPTEFKFQGTMIQDYQNIVWYDNYIYDTFLRDPGLYDDVYMDLTFVEIIDRLGLDAPVDSFAQSFANAEYNLWHANQEGRYNILNGVPSGKAGYWKNNPHADDIDFQIEADFIGLMTPGMINTATAYADKIGHMMNYGDGFYGGAYMSALYSLAFISDDIDFVVQEALKVIPEKSLFHQTITDVINWHKEYPDDWKRCWFEVEKKHSSDTGCPDGVFKSFNIDARVNAAYVIIGLLYGKKDFQKTMEISTRCGQDSDCNPATAAGVLGVMLGYSNIPDMWKPGIEKIEKMNFPYTSISLERVYNLSYEHATKLISMNGGKIDGTDIVIQTQIPEILDFEQSFEGIYPTERKIIKKSIEKNEHLISFSGVGIVITGFVETKKADIDKNYILQASVYLNNKKIDTIKMPSDYRIRKNDIYYNYDLPEGNNELKFVWDNPNPNYNLRFEEAVIYAKTK